MNIFQISWQQIPEFTAFMLDTFFQFQGTD